jgi:hypothetical protein
VWFGTNVSTFHGTLLQIAPNLLVSMYQTTRCLSQ